MSYKREQRLSFFYIPEDAKTEFTLGIPAVRGKKFIKYTVKNEAKSKSDMLVGTVVKIFVTAMPLWNMMLLIVFQ